MPIRLTQQEASRLTARLGWLLAAGVNADRLARQTAFLGTAEREVAGRFLISIAAAVDPASGPAVVGMLTRMYRVLGLRQDLLFSRLHESTVAGPRVGWSTAPAELPPSDRSDQPVVVRRADPVAGGHPLPWAITPPAVAPSGVRLDQPTITRKLAESAAVATLLGGIFDDDDPPAVGPPGPDEDTTEIAGLDLAHSRLLHRLAARRTWTHEEFSALARTHGVLPEGVLDLLNDVAIDTVGAPVVEGDTVLAVNDDILQELLG